MLNLKYTYPIAIDMGEQSIYAAQLKETRQGLAVRGLVHRELERFSPFDRDHIQPPYPGMLFQLTPKRLYIILVLIKKRTLMNRKKKGRWTMLRGVGFFTLILFSATVLSGCAHTVSPVKEPITETSTPDPPVQDQVPGEQAAAEMMVADFLLFRPLGIVATVIGTASFIVSIPFSLPGGNTKAAFQKLVVGPAKYTFNRPLGELEDY